MYDGEMCGREAGKNGIMGKVKQWANASLLIVYLSWLFLRFDFNILGVCGGCGNGAWGMA